MRQREVRSKVKHVDCPLKGAYRETPVWKCYDCPFFDSDSKVTLGCKARSADR